MPRSHDERQPTHEPVADKPQARQDHPDEYQRDLNPNHMAGQNIGAPSDARETDLRTAYDIKGLHRALRERFTDDELKQVPVLPPGRRLQQGATYVDLNEARPREFTALGNQSSGPEHCYAPKDLVPYIIWNRLIGEEKPGQEGPGSAR
jgi:hypothetical protein